MTAHPLTGAAPRRLLRWKCRRCPTNIVDGREPRVHMMPPGPDRWKERSRTPLGMAAAIADQWGELSAVQEVLW